MHKKENLHFSTCMEISNKIKSSIYNEINDNNYSNALRLISCLGELLSETNIYYFDADLESWIRQISKYLLEGQQSDNIRSGKILFYDSFGSNDRGLARIYLQAICKTNNLVYVCYEKFRNRIPDLIRIVEDSNGKCIFIDDTQSYESQILSLWGIVEQEKVSQVFAYSLPNDVIIATLIAGLHEHIIKYQINLTDHGFWLGANFFDYIIEFRDYGASISFKYRNIERNKLIKLPFYPVVNEEKNFQGFPENMPSSRPIVFSGGSLYKTLGGDGKYYEIVKKILSQNKNVVFWYAGSGDDTELKKLINAFPGRVFFTNERSDLFQVLQKCVLYLSTYPVCGGLMYQYAAKAGKIPITLKYDEISDDFLINQDKIGVDYTDISSLLCEVNSLIIDEEYRARREAMLIHAVISETDFDEQLNEIIKNQRTKYKINYKDLNTEKFRSEYLKRLHKNEEYAFLINKSNMSLMFKHFPKFAILGITYKIIKKFKSVCMR